MRIKKLEVFGFKSFADRVVIHFDQGVTGIVGPNGCGKSNVVDALRWVMGEQNAKHLRGDAMQDIIFSGAQGRNGMGLAEVILTFANDGTLVPPEYSHFSEIEVARRIYKNGDSEYEINKRPCRLKDITELFLGTGIGTKAYSIIEQGRVANIIAAKPEEKRLIIEEAAGITKYKARRQAAERKMAATEQNLMRINDVRKEVEGRLGTLERQAKKAAKFHSLMEEIRDLDFHHSALQFFSHTGSMRYFSVEKETISKIIDEKQTDLSAHENLLKTERDRLSEEEKKLALTKELLFEAENALSLSKQEIQHNDQTVILKQKQELQVHDEMRRQEDKKERLFKDQETQEAEKNQVQIEFEAAEAIGMDRAEELKAFSDVRAAGMRSFQARQSQLMQSAQAATRAQAALQNLETQKSMLADKTANIDKDSQNTKQQIDALIAREGQTKTDFEASFNRKLGLDEELENKHHELNRIEADAKVLGLTQTELQKRHALSSSRLTSLQEIEQSFEWSSSGLDQVMKDTKSDTILGLFADFIEVPVEIEEVVELALKDRLETILVKSPEGAFEIIDSLSQKKKGRLRFHAFDEGTKSNDKDSAPPFGEALSKLIKPTGVHGKFIQGLLANIAIVDELAQSMGHQFDSKNSWEFISRNGDFQSRDGALTGGKSAKNSGVLGRKREIRELQTQIEQIESEQTALKEKIQNLNSQREELAHQVHEIKQISQNLAISLARFEENMRSHATELLRLETQSQKLLKEKGDCAEREKGFGQQIEELRQAWSTALASHAENEKLVLAEQENLKVVEADVSQKSEEVTILRVQIAAKKERLNSLSRSLSQIETDLKECETTLGKLIEQNKSLKLEQVELAKRNEHVSEKSQSAEKERAHLTTVLGGQTSSYEKDFQVLKNKENSLSGLRSDLDEQKTLFGELLLKYERHQMALSALSDRLFEKHRIRPEEILHEYHHLPIPDWDFEKRSTELRRSIEQLGAINPTAVEEFEELNERYQFLKMQSDDLKVALSQLESAISKINNMTRIRFEEAFHSINHRFSQVFPRLFRGGKAWLELTNPSDLLTSGVEIYAQPPGKKLGSIALMSGGEKALTAISLIFAIFLIKPSPFCLLDEVDAPLDEANVERFSQIVKEMSKVSQFIVITHNKRTMEVADQLYGVTMESPGVSKTVNVRVSDQLGQVTPKPSKPEDEQPEDRRHFAQLELT